MSDRQDDYANKRGKHMAVMDDRRAEPLEPSNTYPPHARKGFPEVPMSEIDTSPEAHGLNETQSRIFRHNVRLRRDAELRAEAAEAEVARLRDAIPTAFAHGVYVQQGSSEKLDPRKIFPISAAAELLEPPQEDKGRADLPPTLTAALEVPDVKALVEAASAFTKSADVWATVDNTEPVEGVLMDEYANLRAALAALEKARGG